MNIFEKKIQYIKGIGEKRALEFERLGVENLYDLISFYPRTYEDRSIICTIKDAVNGNPCSLKVTVDSRVEERRIRKGLAIYRVIVKDETGILEALWFNQSYIKKSFIPGENYIFFGSVKSEKGRLQIQNPVFERDESEVVKWSLCEVMKQGSNETITQGSYQFHKTCRIVPVYHGTAGLTQNVMRNAIKNALDISAGQLTEYIPADIRRKYNLSEINYAIQNIHFPKSDEDFKNARMRLVFEELFLFQLGLLRIKARLGENKKGLKLDKIGDAYEFKEKLPYKLTEAQNKVLEDIRKDVANEKIINRLIQGDVGSGKTVVAAIALLAAVKSGYQGAFMAPTEILARQHYEFLSTIFSDNEEHDLNLNIVLLSGGLTKKKKEDILGKLSSGEADIAVGTHALLQEDVVFKRLGFIVTDEQHRFGVRQRTILNEKGENPHMLIMTATPIPRTLALILYGDLDISVIDELPPGRRPVKTYAVREDMRNRINEFIEKKIKEGRQAFIVCPLVEESESIEALSVETQYQNYRNKYFKNFKVEYLHGKMSSKAKNEIMQRYASGDIDILISTTVIEVGINVPNASIMIVENSERFGLAQLHQLRGRVGRGKHESFCILFFKGEYFSEGPAESFGGNSSGGSIVADRNISVRNIVAERMKIMVQSNDGFVISEKDLELRGPGDFFGTRQHGLPDFKIANLYHDINILKDAQEAAMNLVASDRELNKEENQRLLRFADVKLKAFAENITV